MRKIIRILFLFMLMIAAILLWFDPVKYFVSFETDSLEKTLNKDTQRKLTYLMSDDEWLSFEIPSFAKQLKFLSMANVISDIADQEDSTDIRYSIEYAFLNTNNQILSSHTQNMKTSFVRFQDENKTFVTKGFYLDTSIHPNISQTFVISLKNHADATKIRLKIKSKDPRIVDVGIRNYFLEKTPEYRQAVKWERMSLKKKDHLARGNIYDREYMTKDEKYNLVSSLWKPNGPVGVEGEDYKTRYLYVFTNLKDIYPYRPIKPNLYADADISATRYIMKGKYDIGIEPMTDEDTNVDIKFYLGKQLAHVDSHTLDKRGKTIFFESHEDGLLEITSTKGISIVLKDHSSKELLDLPPVIAKDYYLIDSNHTIEYRFYSAHKRFIRIECRSSHSQPSQLEMTFLNQKNEIVNTLHKTIDFEASPYDYIDPFIAQSKPFYIYLDIPADVNAIRVSSAQEIHLRLATRSENMIYPVYSFSKEMQPEFSQSHGWFTLRPLDFNVSPYKEMQTTIYKQPDIPTINPLIKLGKYDYEQLFPEGNWRGYSLLLKRPLGENYIRPQSWKGIFTKIPSDKAVSLIFEDDIGLKETAPVLLYQHKQVQSKPVTIYLDDIVVKDDILYGLSGVVQLPVTSVNTSHTLHFSALKNTDFFISNTSNVSDTYFKRNFITFKAPMQFKIMKKSLEESIGFQLAIQKDDLQKVLDFDVHIESNNTTNLQAYNSYTFKKYRLHVNMTNQEAIQMTHTNKALSVSDPIYLTLGENLPIGEYIITVYPPSTEMKSYLFLNHLILDQKAQTRISKEIL